MLTTAIHHSQTLRFILLSSVLGMITLSLFATAQFRLVLQQPPTLRLYLIPLLVGALVGATLGWAYLQMKGREQKQNGITVALNQSEARQQAILAAIPDAIVRLDRTGVYLEIKEPTNFSMVMPVAQMLGKKLNEVLPAAAAQQFASSITQALTTEQLQIFEYTALLQGEERYREARIVPINHDEVIAILRDITPRKQAEAALRQSETRHRALVAAIPDAITRIRRDGVYLDVEPPKDFTPVTDLIQAVGKKVPDVLPAPMAQRLMRAIEQALTSGAIQTVDIEVEIARQRRYREVRVVPSGADEVTTIARDITALKEAELRRERAVAEERHRIGRELHDSVTQTLFSASMIADVLPRLFEKKPEVAHSRLAELRESTRGALAEMRTLLLELRPEALLEADFQQLLQQLAEATTGRSRMPVTYQVAGDYTQLPANVRVAFYRTTQEALNNIVKHAAADKATVNFCCQAEKVELTVQDNGQGFDMQQVSGGHFGLTNMRERMTAIGGDLAIQSAPGQGTTVKAYWPPPPP